MRKHNQGENDDGIRKRRASENTHETLVHILASLFETRTPRAILIEE